MDDSQDNIYMLFRSMGMCECQIESNVISSGLGFWRGDGARTFYLVVTHLFFCAHFFFFKVDLRVQRSTWKVVFIAVKMLFWLHPLLTEVPGPGIKSKLICDLSHSCGNAGSLTHSAMPKIKPAMPQRQARSLTYCATAGTPIQYCLIIVKVLECVGFIPHHELAPLL